MNLYIGAWSKVITEIVIARNKSKLPTVSFASISPNKFFGFTLACVIRCLELLDGSENCVEYNFKFYPPKKQSETWNQISRNPYDAARMQPFLTRSTPNMFSFLLSKHRYKPTLDKDRLEVVLNESEKQKPLILPESGESLALRYRQLQRVLKETITVCSSSIHGRGLFCIRDIEVGEMIIEYTGYIIRTPLSDHREAYYDSKGIGCYMFKINRNEVIDATFAGNAARFINHSCEPNCYSQVVLINGRRKIIIVAKRKIIIGEELTYDYKLPFEESKIACTCSSQKCRKFLN